MHAATLQTSYRNNPLPVIGAVLAGGALTFGLFVMMAKLIESDARPVNVASIDPIGAFIYIPEEEVTIIDTKIAPPPNVTPPPETLPQEVPEAEAPNINGNTGYKYTPPVTTIGTNINMGPQDESARPIVQVEPSYPPEAARDGIEGWVQLRFTISPSGSVTDIEVVDAQPKRLFDREARRALAKWKYQPKGVDGNTVSQPDMQVLLEFTLAQ